MGEGPPIGADITGSVIGDVVARPRIGMPTAEALSVADQLEGMERESVKLVKLAVDGPNGRFLRVIEGTELGDIPPGLVDEWDAAVAELFATRRIAEKDLPAAKAAVVDLYIRDPRVRGISRDPEAPTNGNYSALATPVRTVKVHDEITEPSLGNRAEEVYTPFWKIQLIVRGVPRSEDGDELSLERTYLVLRHALLGLGYQEQLVDLSLTKNKGIERSDKALAAILREGVDVKGIEVIVDYRVDPNIVKIDEPLRVRRPKKKLIKPRGQKLKPREPEKHFLATIEPES